ncbi:MAG: hypothetical protein JKY67_22120 [Pseudomonadales bacterium]|nr:hypothetical protein [Pseudomonadales bacterium]
MTDNNVVSLHAPAQDALTEILKAGAQKLLAQAIEAEVESFLASYHERLSDRPIFSLVASFYLQNHFLPKLVG